LEVGILVDVKACVLEAAVVAYLEVVDAPETGDVAAEAFVDILAAAQKPEGMDEGLVAEEAVQVEDLELMASALLDQIHQEIGLPMTFNPNTWDCSIISRQSSSKWSRCYWRFRHLESTHSTTTKGRMLITIT
jgi:hypothetical protein